MKTKMIYWLQSQRFSLQLNTQEDSVRCIGFIWRAALGLAAPPTGRFLRFIKINSKNKYLYCQK